MPGPAGTTSGLTPTSTTRAKAALAVVALLVGVAIGSLVASDVGDGLRWLRRPVAAPFWLSLQIALVATVVAGLSGTGCGYLLAKSRFVGRDVLEALASLPIILPPTVIGYYLLHLLGDSPSGRLLTGIIGRPLLFTVTGCTIAATVAAFPFCLRAARAAFEGVDPAVEGAARAMGLSERRIALVVSLPLARREITAGITLGFVRALGEYGATLMVGGDIFGRTRTMPIAVADATTTAETRTLVAILVAIALVAMAAIAGLSRHRT